MVERKKKVCVSEVIELLEKIAPYDLAEEWDNCGLQVGSLLWPVKKIWIALDPLHSVVQAAVNQNVDMVITHHPLLFRPMHSINVDSAVGRIVATAVTSQVALYAAHTNLDSAQQGVNDVLARAIGLQDLVPLIPHDASASGKSLGMGRIGNLPQRIPLKEFAVQIKTRLNSSNVKFAGDPDLMVHQVAVCSGSGSSLLDDFFNTSADVYVSGDLRYHDARRVEDQGRALIDVGHFPSEVLIIEPLVKQLSLAIQSKGWQIHVEPCKLEQDPFIVC